MADSFSQVLKVGRARPFPYWPPPVFLGVQYKAHVYFQGAGRKRYGICRDERILRKKNAEFPKELLEDVSRIERHTAGLR